MFLGKLQSRWSGPFEVKRVTPYGALEIWSEPKGLFTINGYRLKHYVTDGVAKEKLQLILKEPP